MSLVVPPGENDTEEELLLRYDAQTTEFNRQATEAEREAANLLENPTPEEAALQREIDQAEAEYQASLASLIAEEDRANQAIHNLNSIPDDQFLTPEEQQRQREAEAALLTFNTSQRNRNSRIEKALELQNLGLIPSAATDQEALLFLEAIEEDQVKKDQIESRLLEDARFFVDEGVTQEEVNYAVRKHKALVKAHNQFQIKYKEQILNARYGRKIPAADGSPNGYYPAIALRKVRDHYEAFGTPNNRNPRNVQVWKLVYPVQEPDDKLDDWMTYVYNEATNEWTQESEKFTSITESYPPSKEGGLKPNGLPEYRMYDRVTFDKSGRFPAVSWLIGQQQGFTGEPLGDRYGVQAYLAETGANPLVKSVRGEPYPNTVGIFNRKRGFKKCEKGYWMYEGIPEESTQCVYMGATVVDSRFSYYPESEGFKYAFYPGSDPAKYLVNSRVAKEEELAWRNQELNYKG
jgi:hypothetical protein